MRAFLQGVIAFSSASVKLMLFFRLMGGRTGLVSVVIRSGEEGGETWPWYDPCSL